MFIEYNTDNVISHLSFVKFLTITLIEALHNSCFLNESDKNCQVYLITSNKCFRAPEFGNY